MLGRDEVIATFVPTIRFTSVDLPTLGRPTTATKPERICQLPLCESRRRPSTSRRGPRSAAARRRRRSAARSALGRCAGRARRARSAGSRRPRPSRPASGTRPTRSTSGRRPCPTRRAELGAQQLVRVVHRIGALTTTDPSSQPLDASAPPRRTRRRCRPPAPLRGPRA